MRLTRPKRLDVVSIAWVIYIEKQKLTNTYYYITISFSSIYLYISL